MTVNDRAGRTLMFCNSDTAAEIYTSAQTINGALVLNIVKLEATVLRLTVYCVVAIYI